MSAGIIPPNKALLVGALVVGAAWFYSRSAQAATATGKKPASGSRLPGIARGYGTGVAPAGGYGGTGVYTAPNIRGVPMGTPDPITSLVTGLVGGVLSAFGGSSAARPSNSVPGGGSPLFDGSTSGSPLGVPNEDARSAVRAGDPYYGSGQAGNNVSPQDAFRQSELIDQKTWNDATYGSSDQGVVSLSGEDDPQAQFRAAEINAQSQSDAPTQQDAVVANPSPGVDYVPDVTYDPSSYTTGADDGGDLGAFF